MSKHYDGNANVKFVQASTLSIANKSAELLRQITEIEKWETVEIIYKIYEAA